MFRRIVPFWHAGRISSEEINVQVQIARVAERFLGAKPSRLEAVEVWGDDRLKTD